MYTRKQQNKLEKNNNYPDAKRHFNVSMIKSVARLLACIYLYQGDLQIAAYGLVIAELLGIGEEFV